MSITLCAEDCWPSSETKVTSCNSWGFPNLPSIYGMHINLRSVQLLCHCQGYIGHVILIFLYQKQILISQVEIKKSKRGFTPTDRSAHPSILAGEFDKSDESGTGCGEYKFSIRTNIRIYLYPKNDTNEYPNIFVSKR